MSDCHKYCFNRQTRLRFLILLEIEYLYCFFFRTLIFLMFFRISDHFTLINESRTTKKSLYILSHFFLLLIYFILFAHALATSSPILERHDLVRAWLGCACMHMRAAPGLCGRAKNSRTVKHFDTEE